MLIADVAAAEVTMCLVNADTGTTDIGPVAKEQP